MSKKFLCLFLVISFVFVLFSCTKEDEKDSGYRYTYAEIAFDLSYGYTEMESDIFDALFTDGDSFVGITRLSFYGAENDDIDGSMSPDTVAKKYAEKNSLDIKIEKREAYAYFIYIKDGYYNLISFYRSKYAHFIVRFMCSEAERPKFEPEFMKYAEGAKFTK